MKKTHVFTSIALNYLPKARMLFQSLKKHHPEFVLHLALADEERGLIDIDKEPFDSVITISSLGVPDWKGWAFCHSLVELATAIKPFVLKNLLLEDGCEKVLYIDPDIVVFSRLDDILDALEESCILLTPHQIEPEMDLESVMDNEVASLKYGIYNLGFLGVSSSGEGIRFADWWSQRAYHFCRVETYNGLFTDQRWIDLVPAFFDDVGIIKSSRHNVATWNLTTRELEGSLAGGFTVDGAPLGFYHFTGFDRGDFEYMALKVDGGNSSLVELVRWYVDEAGKLEKQWLSKEDWAFGKFSTKEPISPGHRVAYRENPDLQKRFKDPFDNSMKNSFFKWVLENGESHYPELFGGNATPESAERFRHRLTPGFGSGTGSFDWKKSSRQLIASIFSPRHRAAVKSRVSHVFQKEGARGLVRRLKNHSSK